MLELEEYTRGLVLAEGSRYSWPKGPGSGIRITMCKKAVPVLREIADAYSINGIRLDKAKLNSFSKDEHLTVCLRHKAAWKSSVEGIERSRHAIRGFFEGDGSLWVHKVVSKGKLYKYPGAGFWFHPDQLFIKEWVRGFLLDQGIEFKESLKIRPGKITLHQLLIEKREQAKKLCRLLYDNATIFFKKEKMWVV
jgi:hypothetical protein